MLGLKNHQCPKENCHQRFGYCRSGGLEIPQFNIAQKLTEVHMLIYFHQPCFGNTMLAVVHPQKTAFISVHELLKMPFRLLRSLLRIHFLQMVCSPLPLQGQSA